MARRGHVGQWRGLFWRWGWGLGQVSLVSELDWRPLCFHATPLQGFSCAPAEEVGIVLAYAVAAVSPTMEVGFVCTRRFYLGLSIWPVGAGSRHETCGQPETLHQPQRMNPMSPKKPLHPRERAP